MPHICPIAFDDWTLDPVSGELERGDTRIRLQDQPLRILRELLRCPGDVVDREHLIAILWPETVVDFENNLNSAVRKLRQALGDDAETPRYIETIPRKGYRFIGTVKPLAEGVEPKLQHNDTLTDGPRDARTYWGVSLVAATLLAIVIGIVVARDPAQDSTSEVRVVLPPHPLRIAVLPLSNLSPDPSEAYFAAGIHEELLIALANRSADLEVISRTTMLSYRSMNKTVPQIAKELQATHVLEGSIRRDGDRVRLVVQLLDTRKDVRIWSQTFDRQSLQTTTLQAEVAEAVAAQLRIRLARDITQLPPSSNPAAYDLLLKARHQKSMMVALDSSQNRNRIEKLLSDAIELDPSYAAAYLARFQIRMEMLIESQNLSDEMLAAMQGDLQRIRELVGDTAPLLLAEAAYASRVTLDADLAARLTQRAIAMNPHSAIAPGTPEQDALAIMRRAARLDPANPRLAISLMHGLWMNLEGEVALRVATTFNERFQPKISTGPLLFAFTGITTRSRQEFGQLEPGLDPDDRLFLGHATLMREHRLAEALAFVEATDLTHVRQNYFSGQSLFGLGHKPVAEMAGWTRLMLGDTAGAKAEGAKVLEFVRQSSKNRWNGWYLRLLSAEGSLFAGDHSRAISEARAVLAMPHWRTQYGHSRFCRAMAARVFAWAGAHEEAIDLLEQLSAEFPAIGPAEITRELAYSMPLNTNTRYQMLAGKLEAAIAANQHLIQL